MNTTEITNKIERMEMELAELKTALKEYGPATQPQGNGRWKPEYGENYYFPSVETPFYESVDWLNDEDDNHLYNAGMVYRTAEEAAEAGKRMYYTEFYRSLSDVTPQMWEERHIEKNYACWQNERKSFAVAWTYTAQTQNVCFTTHEKCRAAIDKLGEDIFVRYVLGVVR